MRRLLFWAMLVFGISSLAYGGFIPAKAWVAQRLLDRAWDRSLAGGRPTRPWPWADTFPLARIRQARLDVDQVVLSGASGRVLAFGPGHIPGTAPPGQRGNTVLSGHRDTHFAWLRRLRTGDDVTLTSSAGTQRFVVAGTAVLHESVTQVLDQGAGERLTLLTCFPFDGLSPGTPWRYVVTLYPATF